MEAGSSNDTEEGERSAVLNLSRPGRPMKPKRAEIRPGLNHRGRVGRPRNTEGQKDAGVTISRPCRSKRPRPPTTNGRRGLPYRGRAGRRGQGQRRPKGSGACRIEAGPAEEAEAKKRQRGSGLILSRPGRSKRPSTAKGGMGKRVQEGVLKLPLPDRGPGGHRTQESVAE